MKKNKNNVFIIITGIFIILVFSVVLKNNINTKYESDSYYASDENNINAKISAYSIQNGKLFITTKDSSQICIKTTKSIPDENHICWKNIENNRYSQSVYKNKKYYLWTKDEFGNLSSVKSIYTN